MPVTLPSEQEIAEAEQASDEHATAVGRIAIGWNGLHDILGSLFVEITARRKRSDALAAWQAVPNDRAKRAMLLAVCIASLGEKAKFTDEIKWMNGQLNPLEDKRNDAVHAPYSIDMEDGKPTVVPFVFNANIRALKLSDKDLALELDSYRQHIRSITWFAMNLLGKSKIPDDSPSWPERPSLPRPAQAKARKS